jgi:uncharacterized protein YodC (DUF2158 family)
MVRVNTPLVKLLTLVLIDASTVITGKHRQTVTVPSHERGAGRMTVLEQIKQNRCIWYNNMGQETRDFDALLAIIDVAINSCRDVTTLGRFASSVDPVRWVEELQAHLETGSDNHSERGSDDDTGD